MAADLPTSYDVIVVGTGMVESIVASACARTGHSVLHVDSNDYYGNNWASFNFKGLQELFDEKVIQKSDRESGLSHLKEGETLIDFDRIDNTIKNLKQTWFVPEIYESEVVNASGVRQDEDNEKKIIETKGDDHKSQDEMDILEVEETLRKNTDSKDLVEIGETKSDNVEEPNDLEVKNPNEKMVSSTNQTKCAISNVWSQQKMNENFRKFNIDLCPRLLYSRGNLVELLISSNIARYTEFKCVSRVLTLFNGELEHVPSSRADVFSTTHISIIEKRMLMKFLNFCLEFESQQNEYASFESKTFYEFLVHRKLTQNIIGFVIDAIAMVSRDTPCLIGLEQTKKFLTSLGRFGNTPFLWPLYGTGELPQAFCRLCAVFGGIYYLNRKLDFIIQDTNSRCCGIITENQRLDCKYLVMNGALVPSSILNDTSADSHKIARGIYILNDSILPSEKEQLTLLRIPDNSDATGPILSVEIGAGAMACPKGLYVLHLTAILNSGSSSTAFDSLLPKLLKDSVNEIDEGGKLVWALNFEIEKSLSTIGTKLSNVFYCPGPGYDLDFDDAIDQAKTIFYSMFADEEFLPRAPDPEEIILDDPEKDSPNEEPIVPETSS